MSPYQIEMTIELIQENFYYFSPDDFRKCFRGAMSGKYGKIYNRLDGAVIMEWLRAYDIERTELIVKEQMQKNKEEAKEIMSDESFNSAMKKLMDELASKTKRKDPEAWESKLSPFEKQVISEYDKLRGSNRFATYKGEEMDFDSYRMIRYGEEIKNQGEL
jgi:predicted transcriptional regulator